MRRMNRQCFAHPAWYQITSATSLALIAAGLLGGLASFLLDHGVVALKPEPRYLVGLLLTGFFLFALLIPLGIYSNRF
jgi:hypothetical protein